jgi:hypothetical protein
MKTLADMKRELTKGKELKLVERFGKIESQKKVVVNTQTNGIYFEKEGSKNGSFLSFPPSSLVEYTGTDLKIYDPGERDLTKDEQSIVDNMPSNRKENAELCERDVLTDGSTTFWMDKRYISENNADWYWKETRGLYYKRAENKMRDNKIKGKLSLHYVVIK